MIQKDYILIAESLKITKPEKNKRESWQQWVRCIFGMANFLRLDNPKFEWNWFLALCGYEESEPESESPQPEQVRDAKGNEMSDADTLQAKIDVYCNRYCINPVFKASKPLDIERDLTAQYPNSDRAGCYAIYTASGELLYIGKASNKNVMGERLGHHFHYSADKTALVPRKDWGGKKPQIIRTIRVHQPYEAPSLEEFLVRELRPLRTDVRDDLS